MEELMFPIKYAVLELKEEGGYSNNYDDIINGYIVSKCYVVGSEIKYFKNGNSEEFFKVVFPYTDIAAFKRSLKYSSLYSNGLYLGEKNIPRFDACDQYYPVNIVSNVYDSYLEAKEDANNRNLELRRNNIAKNSVSELKNVLDRFHFNMDTCQRFEEVLKLETQDMEVFNNQKLVKIRLK